MRYRVYVCLDPNCRGYGIEVRVLLTSDQRNDTISLFPASFDHPSCVQCKKTLHYVREEISSEVETIRSGTLIGAVIGGIVGGPAGAFIGGMLGSVFGKANYEQEKRHGENKRYL